MDVFSAETNISRSIQRHDLDELALVVRCCRSISQIIREYHTSVDEIPDINYVLGREAVEFSGLEGLVVRSFLDGLRRFSIFEVDVEVDCLG